MPDTPVPGPTGADPTRSALPDGATEADPEVRSRCDSWSMVVAATPSQVFAAFSDPARMARWWGPAGFTNTIHLYEFHHAGRWLLTMHGPDGKDYPNESRFTRIVADRLVEIEHLGAHHFLLSVELQPHSQGTCVMWQQRFDTAGHYKALAEFVALANEQNLQRLAAEVRRLDAAG